MSGDLAHCVSEQRELIAAERVYYDAISVMVETKFPTPAYFRASDDVQRARLSLQLAEARLNKLKSALAGQRHLRIVVS